MELGPDTQPQTAKNGAKAASKTAGHGISAPFGEMSISAGNGKKLKLLTRDSLDGRTQAARLWDQLTADIENDLGGRSELSMIERTLVQAYVSAALTMQNLNTRLLLGEEIDFSQHSQCVSAMTRVPSRLGIRRRARTIGPTLGDLIKQDQQHTRLNGAAQDDQHG